MIASQRLVLLFNEEIYDDWPLEDVEVGGADVEVGQANEEVGNA